MPAIWAKRLRYIEEFSAGAVAEGATRDVGTRRCLYNLYGLPIVFRLRLLVDRRFAADDGHNFVQQGKFFRSFCQGNVCRTIFLYPKFLYPERMMPLRGMGLLWLPILNVKI